MASQKPKTKIKSNIRASFILLAFFGIIFIGYGSYLKYRTTILSFKQNPYVYDSQKERASKPAHINIEKINISLKIEESGINDGVWQVSDNAASFLETSARPGENGNIIIYGHNKKSIFGNLIGKDLKGEIIEIINENGESYFYKIDMILTVDPTDIIVIAPTQYEVMTVYTCTGFLDSKRLVLKAEPL